MSDLIDRQAAIDAIEKMQMPIMRSSSTYDQFIFTGMSEVLNAIKELPSVQPEHLQFDCDMAYMQGKIDGIKECTEKIRAVKREVAHETD